MSDTEKKYLAKITALLVTFKDRQLLDFMARIVAVALHHGAVWPDEVSKDGVDKADVNCIGIAYRTLKAAGLIKPTGDWRKSEAEDSHGRVIWKYELASRSLAAIFLKRHGELPPVGQTEMSL